MMRTGIEGLLEFGTHRHSLMGNIKNVGLVFMVMLIWTIAMTVVLTAIAGMGTNEIRVLLMAKISAYDAIMPAVVKSNPWMDFFWGCIFAPFWEEVAYRYVPLAIAMSLEIMLVRGFSHKIRSSRGVEYDYDRGHLYGNLKGTGFILPVMLLSSVVFGLAHGNVMNIMFQGVGGFIFAWLMIKGGYFTAVMAHFMWNFMLMFGMPLVLK